MTDPKQKAAEEALGFLPERGVIGLGTGSTAERFIDSVAALVRAGRELAAVPTSERSRKKAEALGVRVLADTDAWSIEVCVDGADEVSERLDLIKGGGGCHTREKIVNYASRKNIIIVDESKLSAKLGERWAVPVEVLPFGLRSVEASLRRFGEVVLREVEPGRPFLTDSRGYILDVRVGVISDPSALDQALRAIPGVVETGLFIQRADVVIVAGARDVQILRRTG
jgi:ribose 5-phosphate isomerase A